jgi:transposase
MSNGNIVCAGIDTGKHKLDVALDSGRQRLQADNTPAGHRAMADWLRRHRVKRVGIEASGGYEQAVVAELRRRGLVVVVFQPAQVRAYAMFHLQRAKNDRIDAALIASCTAAVKKIHAPPDPRIAALAEHLTMIDQIGEDVARLKNRLETCRDPRIQQAWKEEIVRLRQREKIELEGLVAAIRRHRDLAERLDLIDSVDGVGLPTAVAILVRMPEIGRLGRGEVAALAGLAPFDDDSADQFGAHHIAGGRVRLRSAAYAAALPAAMRWNTQLVDLYRRLIAAGKSHKVALVACARKLLIFVNTVVARGTPWTRDYDRPPGATADARVAAH